MNNRSNTERQLLLAKIRLDRLVMQEKFIIAESAADGSTKLTALWKEYAENILQKITKYPLWAGVVAAAIVASLPRLAIGNTLGRGALMAERIFSQAEGLSLLTRILPSLLPTLLEIFQSIRCHDQSGGDEHSE